MMKSRNVAVTTLIVVSAVAISAACVMLYIEHRRWKAAKSGIDIYKPKLTSTIARYPYPSTNNIVAISNNVRMLEDDAALLRKDMSAGQITVESGMDHLTWLSLLTKRKKDLQTRAKQASVKLPARFSFGFEKYDAGTPPKVSDVRRLELQLKTMEQLCWIIFQSGVSEIRLTTREQFEEQVVADAGRGGAAVVSTNEPPPLFTKEHFTIGVAAKEEAIVELLNGLASCKMFVVVTLVRVKADPGVDVRPVTKAGEDSESGAKPEVRDDDSQSAKVVTGRVREKPADVVLEIDVYGFGAP